ncbi:MAG TPA: winged helix-turn-helix domain-containing protein [Aliidongia sp.]|uniref:ATP-binding protein n=1 Tax=Aliidongia sp. TaxID=1914230 RepID=UPI002DDD877A|nr:winged helix-turn-helix domain-containing protein [Aliidongia sp.]HEV2673013.1 winged helix-turn-helix domain-containing protein [Aliidongia sp.]
MTGEGLSFRFGRYVLTPALRLLVADGVPVPLGQRTLDILAALVEQWPAVVSKDALMQRIWGAQIVEENTLAVHVSALRKALEDGRDGVHLIGTVPRRGYQLLTAVLTEAAQIPPQLPVSGNLPRVETPIVGRDAEVEEIANLLGTQSLVTVAGPGGIGKTRLALAVAAHLAGAFSEGIWWVDLAATTDPDRVAEAVARALGLVLTDEQPLVRLVAGLKGARRLLILDNCEYVADGVAPLAVALREASGCRLLVTSLEPLGVACEQVKRLEPLAVPLAGVTTAAEALRAPAVELFMACVHRTAPDFVFGDDNAEAVVLVCRRLDGIPLALELAAARAALLGARALARRLDERLLDLSGDRRDALAKHRTLRALLDWSYGLLNPTEQVVLRRLGVFAGGCTLEAAENVVADATLPDWQVAPHVASLIAKSLVIAQRTAQGARYKLLETTRAYARERLAEAGEVADVSRLHAEYLLRLFEQADIASEKLGPEIALKPLGPELDNLRAALDWCFGPSKSIGLGLALTAASVEYWLHTGREAFTRVETAFAHLDDTAPPGVASALWYGKAFVEYSTKVGGGGGQIANDRALHFARLSQEPYRIIRAGLHWADPVKRDYATVYDVLEEVRQLCIEFGFYRSITEVLATLAGKLVNDGRLDDAATVLQKLRDSPETKSDHDLENKVKIAYAKFYAAKGDFENCILIVKMMYFENREDLDYLIVRQAEAVLVSLLILEKRYDEACEILTSSDFGGSDQDVPVYAFSLQLQMNFALGNYMRSAKILGFLKNNLSEYRHKNTLNGIIISRSEDLLNGFDNLELFEEWKCEGEKYSIDEIRYLLKNTRQDFLLYMQGRRVLTNSVCKAVSS